MRICGFSFVALTILTLLSPTHAKIGMDVYLNEYGHIIAGGNSDHQTPGFIQLQREMGNERNYTIPGGDSYIESNSGMIAFSFRDGHLPQIIRFYDHDGNLRLLKKFPRIVNLQVSARKNHAAFFDGEFLTVLNLTGGDAAHYPASIVFALDGDGHPAFYDRNAKSVTYKTMTAQIDSVPLKILFFRDTPVIFTAKNIFILEEKHLLRVFYFSGKFFEAKTRNELLYFVEKKKAERRFHYTLRVTRDLENFKIVNEKDFYQPDKVETHETIRAPLHYYESSFPSIVKNSYAQIQEWEDLYLHPGVDLFEDPYEEVFSVRDGMVKAILTTGDERYWRIAIGNLEGSNEGYLYAHLNQNSIPFTVGDTVSAGDIIGTLFPAWGFAPHCHFARITPEGEEWNGNWWTVDNPLVDITNMTDSIPPVFENALGSDLFAFRDQDGTYLDPMDLSAEIQIIARCCDCAHSISFESRISIWDLKFGLYAPQNPDSAVYEKYSYALDMPLDTYFSNQYETLVLNTIYSRDPTCFSTNNSSNRDFFYIITNSDGDSVITPEDSLQVFDTTEFPNGPYLLKVFVRDAAYNETAEYMPIYIDNISPVSPNYPNPFPPAVFTLRQNYPNPFNSITTIAFTLPVASRVTLQVFDAAGRSAGLSLPSGWLEAGFHEVPFNGSGLTSGVYIYRIKANELEVSGKIVLMK